MTVRELIERLQATPKWDVPVEIDVDNGCTECSGQGIVRRIVAYSDRVEIQG